MSAGPCPAGRRSIITRTGPQLRYCRYGRLFPITVGLRAVSPLGRWAAPGARTGPGWRRFPPDAGGRRGGGLAPGQAIPSTSALLKRAIASLPMARLRARYRHCRIGSDVALTVHGSTDGGREPARTGRRRYVTGWNYVAGCVCGRSTGRIRLVLRVPVAVSAEPAGLPPDQAVQFMLPHQCR